MVRTRNVSFKLILCSIEDDTTTFKYQIKCSPDLNVDIQSAMEFTVGDGTRNNERTIYDDMSDAESDPDDEYEEEEGDEIMLEFMSTN